MRVRDSKSLNTRILVELHDAVGYIQDPPKLKETVRTMYEKYGRFTGTAIFGQFGTVTLIDIFQVQQYKVSYKSSMPKLNWFDNENILNEIFQQSAISSRKTGKIYFENTR